MKGSWLQNEPKPLETAFVTYSDAKGYEEARKRASFEVQKGVFYNAKEHLLKSLLPILFTFTVLLRLADGGQCWFS